jgi:DNA-binding transcriptional regulator GbsR (MarR family)
MKDAYLVWPAVARRSTAAGEVSANFERESVGFFAELSQALSVPRSLGQIYGLLFASPCPLSFTDIVERLDISKGSASQGLQLLRSIGAINEAEPTEKRAENQRIVRYEAEMSLRQLVSGVLRERVMPMATTGTARLKRLRQLAQQAPGENEFYLDRVKQLETWRRRLNTVFPVLNTLLGPKKKR